MTRIVYREYGGSEVVRLAEIDVPAVTWKEVIRKLKPAGSEIASSGCWGGMMAMHDAVVFEREDSGVVNAYVAGLHVYAQGATRRKAANAIVRTLRAHLDARPEEEPRAEVQVAGVSTAAGAHARAKVRLVTAAALLGRRTSERKAASSRANSRRAARVGDRPLRDLPHR